MVTIDIIFDVLSMNEVVAADSWASPDGLYSHVLQSRSAGKKHNCSVSHGQGCCDTRSQQHSSECDEV